MTLLLLCIPPWDACKNYHEGHHCQDQPMHITDHSCECGVYWPRDTEYELALLLYNEHWTTRYTDEIEVPPKSAAVIACQPLDSPWRRLARIAELYLPKERT